MPINPHVPPNEARETADAHADFKRACARAFAGTRWKPYRYDASAEIGGVYHTIVLKLTMRDALSAVMDPSEIFLRSVKVRDPRFALRGQHPKRGRHSRHRRR